MFRRHKISSGNVSDYGKDIPDSYRKLILSGDYQAIAVTDENGDDEKYVGVCIFLELDDWIEIVYIHMDREEVLMVEKAEFVRCCIHEVREICRNDPKGVFIEIPIFKDMDDTKDSLSLAGMDVRESGDNLFEFELSMVQERDLLEKAYQKGECISLAEADESVLSKLENLMQNDERPIPVPVFMDWDRYISDISYIYLRKGEPRGVILLSEHENGLVVELAYCADAIALPIPLAYSYKAALEKYGEDKTVIVPVVVNKSAELVKHMVPKAARNKIIEGVMRF